MYQSTLQTCLAAQYHAELCKVYSLKSIGFIVVGYIKVPARKATALKGISDNVYQSTL